MIKLIQFIIALIGVLWLGIAGFYGAEWWEHRPAGTPQIHIWLFSWSPPDSLAAQLIKAQDRLAASEQNEKNLQAALAEQNDAVQRLSDESRSAERAAESVVETYRPTAAQAVAVARSIAVDPGGCPALADADKKFTAYLEAIR